MEMEKTVVTIGRQFGSGGREIGQKLADTLHIAYYDKQLLERAAKESGLRSELFEKSDEKASTNLFHTFTIGFPVNRITYQPSGCLTESPIFQLQSDTIRKAAEESSCVIIGRAADFILKDDPCLTSVFIHADMPDRVERVMRVYSLDEKAATALILKTDKSRADYYNHYTDKTWGAAASYELSINSSSIGTDNAVELIAGFIRTKENRKQ